MDKTEMNINNDILRVGGHYYAIKRIEAQNIDLSEELKDLYDKKHEQHVSQLNEGIVAEAQEDWGKQIEHVRSFGDKGSVHTIPAQLHGRPVMVYNDTLLELRVITYAPNKVRVSRSYAQSYEWLNDPILSDTSNDGRYTVNIRPPFSVPMVVGYSKKLNKLYTPFLKTYHTFSGGDVCTSNHKASEFWALSVEGLEAEMNIINTFSPANREVMGVRMQDLITPESYISIQQREEGIWNASA